MSSKTYPITVDGLLVEVIRKPIKHLRLRVYPPAGRIQVSAPWSIPDATVRRYVRSQLSWIHQQQARFARQPGPPVPQYVSGETHLYQGRPYRLQVVEQQGWAQVLLRDGTTIELQVRLGADALQRERLLLLWYRMQLKEVAAPLIAKWEPVLGVQVATWGVKRMRTKWGTCNGAARRIWLSLDLMKTPAPCLEYVIVHELTHLLERYHNERFWGLLDTFMPRWREYREELNRAPVGHQVSEG